jgi:hypothetical protein
MKLLEFFAESNGSLSSVRLMAFLCVMEALFVVSYSITKNPPLAVDLGLVVTLLGAGFGGKLIQKGIEEKPEAKT